jgi:hypothetical protein
VLKPNVLDDPWTIESVKECFLTVTEEQEVGIAEVIADDISGGWAEAMLEANAQIDNLG